MQYSRPTLFFDDASSEDEIDSLFNQLEVIEPPTSLVQQIISSVAQLPPYPQKERRQQSKHSHEGLIVLHDHLEPS